MTSREDAKKAVERIARKHGYLRKEIAEKLSGEDRLELDEFVRDFGSFAAGSVKTLANNVYGSDSRFVFELLQNADDNRFTRAISGDTLPAVWFKVYHDRIIIECNEDGFTRDDLLGICSIGKSTKISTHGYIGAKGIGFKSVFIAAWKVFIQSGNFSFYFQHRKDDIGLGMVQPIWQDADEVLVGPLTRTTLYLHDQGDPKELEHLRQTVFSQLADLQQTCLLFLRKLKNISVAFYDRGGGLESSKSFFIEEVDNHKVFLKTVSTDANGDTTTSRQRFHVTKGTASGLPKSESRQLPDTDEARLESSQAEIILAFPLTDDSNPLIQAQEIFAFLPVRRSPFKFLIQSDFDTSANRQDVVTTSRRNRDLLNAIAYTFQKAIVQFCEESESDLRYTWPRFLPSSEDRIDNFWTGLSEPIRHRVMETPILKSRHGGKLRKISDLVMLSRDFTDSDGIPLFDDSVADPFVSWEYSADVIQILTKYGLKIMHSSLLLALLRADLDNAQSRLASGSSSQTWHSAVAKLLLKFAKASNGNRRELGNCSLLPLRTGEWVSPASVSAYLPTTNGIPVPLGVDLPILDPVAVANSDRRELFIQLGATEPQVDEVRALVMKASSTKLHGEYLGLAESKAALHYLYLTHTPEQPHIDFKYIYVRCSDGNPLHPLFSDLYIQSDHPYGPEALLGPADGSAGLRVNFLHPAYLEDVPSSTSATQIPFSQWVQDYVGIRKGLRLTHQTRHSLFRSNFMESKLSEIWYFVAQNRPRKLLGMLKHLWQYEGYLVSGSGTLKAKIRKTSASLLCSIEPPEQLTFVTLGQAFLPLPGLQQECSRFMNETDFFPFLALDGSESPEDISTAFQAPQPSHLEIHLGRPTCLERRAKEAQCHSRSLVQYKPA